MLGVFPQLGLEKLLHHLDGGPWQVPTLDARDDLGLEVFGFGRWLMHEDFLDQLVYNYSCGE